MRAKNRTPVRPGHIDKSHADEIARKLIRLRKATISVEELLFKEWASSPFRDIVDQPEPLDLVIQKEWHFNSGQRRNCERRLLHLARLSVVYEIDCLELAHILIRSSASSRKPNLVHSAARWAKNKIPICLLDPHEYAWGRFALEQAERSGDLNFLNRVKEFIRYDARKAAGKIKANGKIVGQRGPDDKGADLKMAMNTWWRPIPKLSWPGLAYCKDKAQRDFFKTIGFNLQSPTEIETIRNFLYNKRNQMGLIPSKNRFISRVEVDKRGHLQFS